MPTDSHCPACGNRLSADGAAHACPVSILELALAETRFIGKYELVDELARGGMGIVYRARPAGLESVVALKMIQGGAFANAKALERFRLEARAASRLGHPNIIAIHDSGEHEGQPFFTMPLMEGGSLADRMATTRASGPDGRGGLEPRAAAALLAQVARAVHHAHQRNVLHRDLKPSNIVLDAEGRPYVTDFGLAKLLEEHGGLSGSADAPGTLNYMAPEQADPKDRELTTAVDIYGLGAVLYELLTGQPPFLADTRVALALRIARDEPRPPSALAGGLDRDLDTICLKCLEKEPARRYGSAEALAEDLERWLRNEPILARPGSSLERLNKWRRRRPTAAALLAVSVMALLALVATSAWYGAKLRASRGTSAERELMWAGSVSDVGDAASATAILANLVRRQPDFQPASDRVMSALAWRNFPLLAVEPLAHPTGVASAFFSPDGSEVMTLAFDHSLRFWDATTGALRGPPVTNEFLYGATYSPDGKRVLLRVRGGIRFLDVATRRLATNGIPIRGSVYPGHWDAAGKRLVTRDATSSASELNRVRVWNGNDGSLLHEIRFRAKVISAFFTPDGSRIITLSEGSVLVPRTPGRRPERRSGEGPSYASEARAWNADTGNPDGLPFNLGFQVNHSEISPDGDLLLVTSRSSFSPEARVWDWRNGQPVGPALRHDEFLPTATFSPDGQRIATTSQDGTARLWDARTGQPLCAPLRHDFQVTSACFSPDGLRLITWGNRTFIHQWDGRTGERLGEPLRHPVEIEEARFAPDGVRVLTWCKEHSMVRLWDLRDGRAQPLVLQSDWYPYRQRVQRARESFLPTAEFALNSQSLGIAPDGRHVVRQAGSRIEVRLADADPATTRTLQLPSPPDRMEFSDDGRFLAANCSNRVLFVWALDTGSLVAGPLAHEHYVHSFHLAPDGRWLAVIAGHQVHTWDLEMGRAKHPPFAFKLVDGIHRLTPRVDPTGRRVAFSSNASNNLHRVVRVADLATARELASQAHEEDAGWARFSPDGSQVVSIAKQQAFVWSVAGHKRGVRSLRHDGNMTSARFNADGSRVVTTSRDGTARVWDSATGAAMAPPFRHDDEVADAAFTADGRVITASYDGTVRFWDVALGRTVAEPLRHAGPVSDVWVSPDGARVVSLARGRGGEASWWLWHSPTTAAFARAPDWLPRLAEAIGGLRLDERGVPELPGPEHLRRLREELTADASTNSYLRWARWVLADRGERKVSPESSVDLTRHVERCLAQSNLELTLHAARLQPTNVLALAALARLLAQRAGDDRATLAEAEWFSRRALALAPNSADVLAARAEVLAYGGRAAQAAEALRRAGSVEPRNPEFWTKLGRAWLATNRLEEARGAFTRAIEALAPIRRLEVGSELYRSNLLDRAAVWRALGREVEAGMDISRARGLPLRTNASPRQIDLTAFYNATLAGVSLDTGEGRFGFDTLTPGLPVLDDVVFDVRGLIKLSSRRYTSEPAAPPVRVENIPVQLAPQRLHFLHGARGSNAPGDRIGAYVIHFTDGPPEEFPILYGRDVLECEQRPGALEGAVRVVWAGTNVTMETVVDNLPAPGGDPRIAQQVRNTRIQRPARLFKSTWTNPRPDARIERLDFVSAMTDAAPLLVAITAE